MSNLMITSQSCGDLYPTGCLSMQWRWSHSKITPALVDVWQLSETNHSKCSLGNFQHWYSCADVGILCVFLSLCRKTRFYTNPVFIYLMRRFYTMLVIKYLMASFYATGSGIKCIMICTLNAVHKKKILYQLINLCLLRAFGDHAM